MMGSATLSLLILVVCSNSSSDAFNITVATETDTPLVDLHGLGGRMLADDVMENNDDGTSLKIPTKEEGIDEMYESDYETSFDDSSDDISVIYTVVQNVFIVFGIVGNAFVTVTWSKVKQFNTTTFLLSFLGACDLIFLFIMLVMQFFFLLVDNYTYPLAWSMYIIVYLSYVAQFTSIFTTVLISITRYMAVKFPFTFQVWFGKSFIKILIVAMIILSTLTAVPASTVTCLFMYWYTGGDANFDDMASPDDAYLTVDSGYNNTSNSTQSIWASSTPEASNNSERNHGPPPADGKIIEVCGVSSQEEKILLMVANAMMNIVPWLVVIPMNMLLIHEVRKSTRDRKQITSKEDQSSRTMDVVVMIISLQSIVAYPIFFLMELLTTTIDWEYYFGGEPPFPLSDNESMHITTWKDCFHILNSSVNIVAYMACGRRFRKIFLQEVLKCGSQSQVTTQKSTKRSGVESVTQDNYNTLSGTKNEELSQPNVQ